MNVLYEDNHLLIINKKNGELVQADTTDTVALEDQARTYIKEKYNKPGEVFLHATHRIDRPVSGIIIFARTSKALARMNALFQEKKIQKTYWALVEGRLENTNEVKLENFMRKNEKSNKSFITESAEKSQNAILYYKTIQVFDNFTLLEIRLETGRHHQIRCQLGHIGHAIRGDVKYGARRNSHQGMIALHARKIAFEYPVQKENTKETKRMKLEAPIISMAGSIWKPFLAEE